MRTEEEALKLYNDHIRYVYQTIYRQFSDHEFRERHGLDKDEIEHFGKMGLLKACQEFDESKDVKFSTFAINHIFWMISNESKRNSLGSDAKWSTDTIDKLSLDENVYTDARGVNYNLYDYVESDEEGYSEFEEDYEYARIINHLRSNVSERLLSMLIMRAGGYTYEEIGSKLGTSHQNVRQIFTRNKKKLAKLITESQKKSYA